MNSRYIDSPGFLPPDRFALPRYRVCLHSAGTDQTRRVAFTNSPTEAVREFLRHGPLTDRSDLYVWDREQKQIVAKSNGSTSRPPSAPQSEFARIISTMHPSRRSLAVSANASKSGTRS